MMAFKFELLGCTPSFETPCAKEVISSLKKLHFDAFNFKLCSLNQLKTTHRQWRCSSAVSKEDDYVSKVDEAVYQIQLT